MNRRRKTAIIIITAAVAVLITAIAVISILVKNRTIFLNQIFISQNDTVGVDISKYQAEVDMDELYCQGISFAYIKATEGSSHVDEKFADNWANAARSPIKRGAYHFFSFDSDGDTQAKNYINTVGDLTGALRPVVDVEFYGDYDRNPPPAEDVVPALKQLIGDLEAEYGVKPVIYASGEPYKLYIRDHFADCPRWVRSIYYHADIENGSNWLIWQYSDRGRLSGYEGDAEFIDLNVLNRRNSLADLVVD